MSDALIVVKSFEELSAREMYAIMDIRQRVFAVEQGIVYCDTDGRDLEPGTRHYWVQGDNEDTLASYLRTLDGPGAPTVIGRVATLADYRSRGYGRLLVERVIADAQRPIAMHAQAYLKDWYASMGFVPVGDIFIEEEIEHIEMRLD